MWNPCQSKTSSGKFARCKSATLLSTRLQLNHVWPNSYSVSQIGGRSVEGMGWIPALFSGSVALAQSNIPRSPIHAQFCNTEHREPGQDQAQLGHRQGGCQGLEHLKTSKNIWYHPENNWGPIIDNLVQFEEDFNSQTEKWSGPVQSGPVGMVI